MVAAEAGVGGHQQVAQVYRVADVAPLAGRYGPQEAVHLVERVGDEHGLEVVAALHAVADAGGDGVDVFQHGRVFDTSDVGRDDGFQFGSVEGVGQGMRPLQVVAAHGEVGESLEGHLLGVAGTADDGQLRLGHVVEGLQILGDNHILVGYDALDSRHHEFAADVGGQLLEVSLHVGRGRHQYQGVGRFGNLVDVGAEMNARSVEGDIRQVHRVVAGLLEIGNTVVAPHVPQDAVGIVQRQFGQRRSPTAAPHDRYFTGNGHVIG